VDEGDANEFAAAFLMPEVLFRATADANPDEKFYYPKKIAAAFNVSEEAVLHRGRNLGMWQ
jgi:Zn-dependent peptidase ImmA (M78 family)